MLVMKFGGTSVGTGERIAGVAELVAGRLAEEPFVVVSAMGGRHRRSPRVVAGGAGREPGGGDAGPRDDR